VARPPCLGPRPRPLDVGAVEAFTRWLTAELALGPSARVSVTEWVSLDSREVPHTTFVSVTSRLRQLAFSIGKNMEAIEADDLPQSVRRNTRAERDVSLAGLATLTRPSAGCSAAGARADRRLR
jgi:hypothetical protein